MRNRSAGPRETISGLKALHINCIITHLSISLQVYISGQRGIAFLTSMTLDLDSKINEYVIIVSLKSKPIGNTGSHLLKIKFTRFGLGNTCSIAPHSPVPR